MAKPIKETPILYGKDAENFLREIGELDEQSATAPVEDSPSAGSAEEQPCRTCDNLTIFEGSLWCIMKQKYVRGSATGCREWIPVPNKSHDGRGR